MDFKSILRTFLKIILPLAFGCLLLWFLYRKMDIVYQDNKHYLSKSMSFSSPSAAACFVLGASTNGWTEWKDKSGRTLDELFRRQAEKA